MNLLISETPEELSRLRLTLGRGLKQIKDRRELGDFLARDNQQSTSVIILSSSMDLSNALSIAEELRVSYPTIGVLLLRKKLDSAVVSQAMSAGIRDVININDPEAIVVACKRSEEISRRQRESVSQQSSVSNLGRIVTFHGARDGVGVTSTAINIATDLAQRKGMNVCLVDTCPIFGDVGVRFRLEATKSWANLIELSHIDDEALMSTLHKHSSGLHLLLSPRERDVVPNDINAFVTRLLRTLQEKFELVIIDTESRLGVLNREIMRISSEIVILSDLDLASLKNLKIRIKELTGLDVVEDAIKLYLNKADLRVGIDPADIPELIGLPITQSIPWDADITRFANEGLQIVNQKPRSAISHIFEHASDDFAGSLSNRRSA